MTEAVLLSPHVALTAVALMTCDPAAVILVEVEQDVALVHVLRVVVLFFLIVMDAIPLLSLAVAVMLRVVFVVITVPFAGEVIATVGGAGVVIEMLDDCAEALPDAA